MARNLLQHKGAYIPITWVEGIAMQTVRDVMNACASDIADAIVMVRDGVKILASSLKATNSGKVVA